MTKGHLPLQDYLARLSYLAVLLLASFLFLPRSSTWISQTHLISIQHSSSDRPEHPFLTPLTSDPLSTMAWTLPGTFIIMIWWSHHMSNWWTGLDQGEKRVVDERELLLWQNRLKRTTKRLSESALCTIASAIMITPILIGVGAPLVEHIPHTFSLALHLTVLIVWPVIHVLGIPSIHDSGLYDRYRMTKLLCDFRTTTPLERALIYPVIGTICGAWLGTIPIPLDWDRPWQSYPLTPTFGSILGFIAGGFASLARSGQEQLKQDLLKEVSESSSSGTKGQPIGKAIKSS